MSGVKKASTGRRAKPITEIVRELEVIDAQLKILGEKNAGPSQDMFILRRRLAETRRQETYLTMMAAAKPDGSFGQQRLEAYTDGERISRQLRVLWDNHGDDLKEERRLIKRKRYLRLRISGKK